ncbi:MAG: transcription termination factor NusA [Candidatus Omnitrophica bacterium]|nr:transcription termination factor NusA [Candidatus Omnitrophota bacterium]MBU1090660.1 transcription termination factor NusA [Candidatus Omnitrophota bacterium]MBU1906191.1 transcription termination factor NusA [Candidatus Omnitrophota bacterium]
MSQELLAIIEQIEREKGIKKAVLIEAVEAALLSATKKVVDLKPDEELKISLDPESGEIKALRNNKEITNIDFGRIAASTARQVIIQKIREAEKDVIFNEFQGKVGEIVSGTVYRFERGNIVIDLLGKAEGVLFKREQSPKDEYKQGQRIRAYIVEARKETKGAQIILSRAHPNFVKKLFELEVPEIYEGIVEIKSISRYPGERTKLAVCSKNEKVDAVGACVGMRGNRVRNIVNELQGEKIDIVRFSEDIKEYIKASLSPAQVKEIKLEKEKLKAEVIVENDQLSLAIGKHGQNVRLASRLVGWELDIRTKETSAMAVEEKEAQERKKKQEEKEKETKKEKKEKKTKKKEASLEQLPGVGEKMLANLKQAGISTLEELLQAGVEGLTAIKGIGEKKAEKIIEGAKKLK